MKTKDICKQYGFDLGQFEKYVNEHNIKHKDGFTGMTVEDAEIAAEVVRYENAIKTTRRQFEHLRNNIPEDAPTELGAFISLHIMLLNDATISRDPIDIIEEKKINAEWALSQQIDILLHNLIA